eukprot:361871-Chlamydomonas_euryale.AAC.6
MAPGGQVAGVMGLMCGRETVEARVVVVEQGCCACVWGGTGRAALPEQAARRGGKARCDGAGRALRSQQPAHFRNSRNSLPLPRGTCMQQPPPPLGNMHATAATAPPQ